MTCSAAESVPCGTPVRHQPKINLITDEENGRTIERTTCLCCHRWLGDRMID